MQTARMKNWKLYTEYPGNPRLFGNVRHHPQLGNEDNVTTSPLREIDFVNKIAVTQNTVYILED